MNYIPLNIKTEYDLMNSLIKIDELVSYAKKNNINSIGITDSNLFGTMEFISKCNNNSIYSRTRYSLDGTQFGTWGVPRVILADGSSIDLVYMASSSCSSGSGTSKALKNVCGEIFVDINGIKPPNATGKDIFWFRITKYGIVPGGTENDTSRDFENYCNKSKPNSLNGYGCAAWVIYNENMDYLRCNDLSWTGKTKCK